VLWCVTITFWRFIKLASRSFTQFLRLCVLCKLALSCLFILVQSIKNRVELNPKLSKSLKQNVITLLLILATHETKQQLRFPQKSYNNVNVYFDYIVCLYEIKKIIIQFHHREHRFLRNVIRYKGPNLILCRSVWRNVLIG